MKRKLQLALLSLSVMFSLAVPARALAAPSGITSSGLAPVANMGSLISDCSNHHFFGLVPWYQYLGKELDDGSQKDTEGESHKCEIKCFNLTEQGSKPNACGQTKSDVPLVLLAIIDDMLRIAGMVAVGYVLYGAFRYVGSQGSPEQTAKAQNTIMNALIGLALAMVSVGFVAFLGNKLGSI